jgi:hypothetical protein
MKTARKLLIAGGSSIVMIGSVLALPPAQPAGATSGHHDRVAVEAMKKPPDRKQLKDEANTSFGLSTDIDSGDHMLRATVTNKSDKAVLPRVTFNDKEPLYSPSIPLEPGKSFVYTYNFSGNNFPVKVAVSGEGMESIESNVMVDIQEPVSFKVTETSEGAVIGTLSNNSTLVPQTVYTRVGGGVRIENLDAGESRTIALPFTPSDGQKMTGVTIATSAGYESSYSVELGVTPELPGPLPR